MMASAIAVPLLLAAVAADGDALATATAGVYGASLVALLTVSGVYNLLSDRRRKEKLRPYDHAAIFILIAGTYTPFSLVTIGGTLGRVLCASVWLAALAGAALKILRRRRHERLFVAVYVALGWAGVPMTGILMVALPASAFVLLAAGGILYTVGVAFHLSERLPYGTALWHGFVLIAAACHYVAVLEALTAGGTP
jgi:hemolysin III